MKLDRSCILRAMMKGKDLAAKRVIHTSISFINAVTTPPEPGTIPSSTSKASSYDKSSFIARI